MNTIDLEGVKNYGKHYDESSFWQKIGKVAKKAGRKTIYLALLLYYTLMSPDVTIGNKAIIVGALGYFICPIDLIPDVIPALGFTDDVVALTLAYKAVMASVTPDIKAKANAKLSSWFD